MNEQELFCAALEQEKERHAAFLDSACGTDEDLRRRLDNLLQCHGHDAVYFQKPAAENLATDPSPPFRETCGTVIGRYKLLEQVGEGGMGVVFVADAQGQALFSLRGSTQTPWDCLAFSSDGKRLASGSGVVKVWDTQTGQELLTFKVADSGGIAFSSDNKRLATASQDDTVKIWDAQNGQELLDFKAGHTNRIMCLAFSPDGKRLVTAGGDGLVKMWDVQAGHEILAF